MILLHPTVGQTPSFSAHVKWTQPSVSLWPTCWTQSVEAATQHLHSSCDICFHLHLLRCHSDMAASMTECHWPMNQPQKHFVHLPQGMQVKAMKLSCLLSVSTHVLSQTHPLLFPSVIFSFYLHLLEQKWFSPKMKCPNCCKRPTVQINWKIEKATGKRRGQKGIQGEEIDEQRKQWFEISAEAIWVEIHTFNMFTNTVISSAQSQIAWFKYHDCLLWDIHIYLYM